MTQKHTTVILVGAGLGIRLRSQERKAWASLGGRPLLCYALDAFRRHPAVSEIILVVAPADVERATALIAQGPARITEKVVAGGAVRRDSVWHGLQEVRADAAIVLVHDAARPFISTEVIDRCLAAISRHGAALAALPIADTLKRESPTGGVAATVAREGLWGAQTPQGARRELLTAAYARAVAEDWEATDDAGILERAGHRVHLVEGDARNFKVTRPEDLSIAEDMLMSPKSKVQSPRSEGSMYQVPCPESQDEEDGIGFEELMPSQNLEKRGQAPFSRSANEAIGSSLHACSSTCGCEKGASPHFSVRTGFGYDVHRLVEGRALILGGVTIPYERGLLGHSDADVLTHAVMDALLGAAALGDIGHHFPDTDVRYRGISSLILLGEVARLLAEVGYVAVSIDVTLAAEAPKVAPHVQAMRTNLAGALGVDVARISVKATTTEGLGFVGTGEGMAAYAVVTVAEYGRGVVG